MCSFYDSLERLGFFGPSPSEESRDALLAVPKLLIPSVQAERAVETFGFRVWGFRV